MIEPHQERCRESFVHPFNPFTFIDGSSSRFCDRACGASSLFLLVCLFSHKTTIKQIIMITKSNTIFTLAFLGARAAAFLADEDAFNYGVTVGNNYGPKDWGKVECTDHRTCVSLAGFVFIFGSTIVSYIAPC